MSILCAPPVIREVRSVSVSSSGLSSASRYSSLEECSSVASTVVADLGTDSGSRTVGGEIEKRFSLIRGETQGVEREVTLVRATAEDI